VNTNPEERARLKQAAEEMVRGFPKATEAGEMTMRIRPQTVIRMIEDIEASPDSRDTEMARLRLRVAELESALEPFAKLAEGRDGWADDSSCSVFPRMALVRQARAALAGVRTPLQMLARRAIGKADRLAVATSTVLTAAGPALGAAMARLQKAADDYNEAAVAELNHRRLVE
jgi:hypothetical protein